MYAVLLGLDWTSLQFKALKIFVCMVRPLNT